ncbi:MAG: hypothetical protein LBL59_04105 [Xanthomonadaceae bacterium]|jgi:hypothetical protein|nr:hypothetical protein [Xanthomonadaceae bacterium]
MLKLPPPPVPQRLREMLEDYPEHIQELQRSLNLVVEKPSIGTPPFEVAIWALEDELGSFIDEAREELHAAEASGDAVAIERAKAKKFLMGCARLQGIHDVDDLWSYFQANSGAFR